MDSLYVDTGLLCRVSPFRNPRINAYLQLPVAYRSLSRLSSAPDAKAFPLYSLQLDLVGASSTSFVSAKCGEHSLVPLRLLSLRKPLALGFRRVCCVPNAFRFACHSQGYSSFGHLWFSKEKLELCRLPSRLKL